jgi:S1-C subfamily serine protease
MMESGRHPRRTVLPLLMAVLASGCGGAPEEEHRLPVAAAQPAAVTRAGSGFFLGDPGRVATAAHLVAGCSAVEVVPEGGAALQAEIRSVDAALDVAELQVSGAAPTLAALILDLPALGAALTALGYAEAASDGTLHRLPLTAIALPIPRPPERLPLRGAVAHPGMSGAPVVDARGRVVGMLLGRGDRAAPGSTELAERIGFPVAEVAVAVPARWLPQPEAAAPVGEVTVARVLCLSG